MKNRFFSFGCSFTYYNWPTWADILSLNYNLYQNWGKAGQGNHFIFYSLIECIQRNKLTKNDTVAIMWTSVAREDRFINGHWRAEGSVYNSSLGQDYIDNHTDPTGYYLTSVTLIDAAKKILDSIGCKHYFFSMTPMNILDDYLELVLSNSQTINNQIYNLYKDTLKTIRPSVYELLFKNDWHSLDSKIIPSKQQHGIDSIKQQYQKNAGPDWPTFNDFLTNNYTTTSEIQCELTDQFVDWRDNILTVRQDQHPTPIEHYRYLEKLGIELSTEQKFFAENWEEKVCNQQIVEYKRNKIKRFI